MKLRCIEMVNDDEDDEHSSEGDFKCPACGGVWFEFREGSFADNTSCDHIRFICLSDAEIVCFNGLTLRDLNIAIAPPLPTDGSDTATELREPDASSLNQHILANCGKNDFWRGVKLESVNALFYFEEHGGSILFGARFDPPLAETTDAGA